MQTDRTEAESLGFLQKVGCPEIGNFTLGTLNIISSSYSKPQSNNKALNNVYKLSNEPITNRKGILINLHIFQTCIFI